MAEIPAEVAAAVLLTVRWFVALRVQPHWSYALGRLWWPVSLALAAGVAVASGADPVALGSVSAWAVALAAEVLLGAGLGVVASLPAYALLGGATASAAALPTTPQPLVRMSVSAALVVALALRLHHPALIVLRDQALVLPPGQVEAWLPSMATLPAVLAVHLDGMVMLALTLATPVLLTVVVVRACGAALGSGPSVARPLATTLGPAVATLAALLAFVASWSVYPIGWARAAVSVSAG